MLNAHYVEYLHYITHMNNNQFLEINQHLEKYLKITFMAMDEFRFVGGKQNIGYSTKRVVPQYHGCQDSLIRGNTYANIGNSLHPFHFCYILIIGHL